MKFKTTCLIIILSAVSGILPARLFACDNEMGGKPVYLMALEYIPVIFIDSIPLRKAGNKKEQDRPTAEARQAGNRAIENHPGENRTIENKPDDIRRIDEIKAENQRIRQKSAIKQVPRSVPKLKPKAVTDRAPIRRPPMRIPKKGFGGIYH